MLHTLLGRCLGLVVWLWIRTWRVRVSRDPGLRLADDRPMVFAFWHGQQMPLLAVPRRQRTAVMVSHSRDGGLQSGVMGTLGLWVIRGSASRGGAVGLRRLLSVMRCGADVAMAVDGPRGPARRVKGGAARAAAWTGSRLVPAGAAASRCVVLERAWDRFEIPLPFARVAVHLGAPVASAEGTCHSGQLDHAIDRAIERARGELTAVAERSGWRSGDAAEGRRSP